MPADLEISIEKVIYILTLARHARGGAEMQTFIHDLNDDEKAHLTAIAWVGRGVFDPADYAEAVTAAFDGATTPTAQYLTGMPHLAENLETGLEALGVDVSGAEEDFR